MTTESANPPAGGQPASSGRAPTIAFQNTANRVVRGLLHVPLISRGVGKRLMTLYVVGRKSGRRYSIPVAYTRYEDALLVATPFGWGRNLRTGEPVDMCYLGKRRAADVQVIADEDGVVEHYDIIARHNRSFAKFNKISLDQDGNPRTGDLHKAWAAGARVFLLTPR